MNEGVDYYYNEEGLMVFTRQYHLKRGYCCKNQCKHCPWNYKMSADKNKPPQTNKKPKDAVAERNENFKI
jgi:hypothetical protein